MKAKRIIGICLLIGMMAIPVIGFAGENAISLRRIEGYINGGQLVECVIVREQDETLISAIPFFNSVGAVVTWKENEQKLYVELKDKFIVVDANNAEVWINGEEKVLHRMPQHIDGYLMVTTELLELIGYQVTYIDAINAVCINDMDQAMKEPITVDEQASLEDALPFLHYDPVTQYLSFDQQIDLSYITVEDNYLKRQLIFNITGADQTLFYEGSWQGNLGHLKGITVTMTNEGIKLIVNTQTVCTYDVVSEEGKTSIKFMKPREKYSKIIVLDPGHGGADEGTSYGQYKEKLLVLDYGTVLYNKLQQDPDIKVYTTRLEDLYATETEGTIGKQYPTRPMRIQLANEIDPDLYISIHVNWWKVSQTSGTETYYFPDPQDTRGKQFATIVQNALVNSFKTKNRGIKDGSALDVVRETNAPAILIETGFISNDSDRAKLISSDYGIRFADIIYGCILNYYAQQIHTIV